MPRIILSACAAMLALPGCTSDPLRPPQLDTRNHSLTRSACASSRDILPVSRYRESVSNGTQTLSLDADSTPDAYVRWALYHSPELESAYQRWVAATERVPQVGALPDPRLSVGFFANEVETRVGAQQARIGISQRLPWLGALRASESAALGEARAAWVRYKAVELSITRRVVSTLYALHELDESIRITRENLDLLVSFEDSVRARYRVGAGSHPDLVRTQVELGMLDDRITSLESSRSVLVARLNALLDRTHDAPIDPVEDLPIPALDAPLDALLELANETNPTLVALGEQVIAQQHRTDAARYAGKPELTVGVETILTDDATNPSIPESGDDPLLLSFSINLPIWREKYDAQVRESIAQRLALSHDLQSARSDLSTRIVQAHFEYTDAQRRVDLYEHTLIPKASESIQSTLASFRTGSGGFTDLLDAQRTLLEFELNTLRARTTQGIASAALNEFVGISHASEETESEIMEGTR